ncbi:MAG: ketose-bisphosphate aldolase [Calditrichaeota bacterium]|nr:ketose-bisphosphate aldolase [Calditrichota bacterium]
MPLVDMRDMLFHAYRNGYAIGAFDLVSLDFLEGILQAAERQQSPVILSLAESHFDHYNFAYLMAATVAAARSAQVPVAIHLDHGTEIESVVRAIRLGCNGVMLDASHLPYEDNVRLTREVVHLAHACGIPVEGELGYVAGVEGEDAQKHPGNLIYTSPEEARRFVAETQVDFLAVSIGTVHGRLKGTPQLDIPRLQAIHQQVDLPLVIHGGTGLTDAQYRQLIDHGVAKINYYTALSEAAANQIQENGRHQPRSYTDWLQGVRPAIQREVEARMQLWGSSGKAEEVLARCKRWREVEHVVEFNVDASMEEAQVLEMMRRGRPLLEAIPGVRRVFTGKSLTPGGRFRYCWIIRFAHSEVIASYRDHPDHQQFADTEFRPIAGDRLTIDFEELD